MLRFDEKKFHHHHFALKLESCMVLPEESAMVNSGDLRRTVTVGTAKTDVTRAATRNTDVIFCLLMTCLPMPSILVRNDFRWRSLSTPTCFHLSAIRCISTAPAAAASSAVCSPFRTLATILGTTELLKISMYAGVANAGTPRFGVQCSASFRATYLYGGSPAGSFYSRTIRSGTVLG